ncbi:fructose-bisphosphate aldolase class I [Candidatus Saccharibacteria bacterium]|nr:fructose-bisphosphate aldolase class I [Candidatus Saccharibacteria bacterium]
MHILIVGNVLKDVYLNLDTRSEHLETDQNSTEWLDLSFDASEHHFFNRDSSLGGAAVTLEVLNKLTLEATVSGSDLKNTEDGLTSNQPAETYRYILISNDQPCYFVPTNLRPTHFIAPTEFYDYIFIDRSAFISSDSLSQINAYLDLSKNTKLIVYLENFQNPTLNNLLSRADLIFCENLKNAPKLTQISEEKLIHLSEQLFSYQNVSMAITPQRVDILTHLSFYSIASATILGCFILGKSVEDSLKLAKINVESSKLDATLSLSQLESLAENLPQAPSDNLELIASNLVLKPKGILAADESGGSIHKKFENLNIDDTYENRRDYRNVFFTTPGLEDYINGVILFDETARQLADNGQTFTEFLTAKRIIPGIKVDQGLEKFPDSDETFTKGLEGLDNRLQEYYQMGLRFAKWRAAFEIHLDESDNLLTPTDQAINENCRILAEYAKKCQNNELVPIVEPELVYDGNYSIEKSSTITGKILDTLFKELKESQVNLKACILKINMVLAGKQFETKSTPEEVGAKTAETLKNHVPAELAGVVFLSGGQTPEEATENLSEVIKNGPFPWPVTFSFARALQDPALHAWAGNNDNKKAAQDAFKNRLAANCNALKSAEV